MQPLSVKRLTVEDLADAPKGTWKEKLSYFLTLVFQQLYNGLKNNLTPEENCQEQTVTFNKVGSSTPANNTYQFSTTFAFKPSFIEWWVVPTDNSIKTAAVEITGNYANGTFYISGIAGLTTDVPYSITIRLWFPPVLPNGGSR